MKSTFHISFVTIRELLYEKVFYLLLVFAILSLGVSVLLGQLTYAEKLKMSLDFMLSGMQISMVLFAVFMAISLFHKELQLKSVYMILSKPISRSAFLVGKFLGQLFIQIAVIFSMGLITYFLCVSYGEFFSINALFQSVLMVIFETSILAALSYLLAANMGALTSAIITFVVFLLGHIQQTVNVNIKNSGTEPLWAAVKMLIPSLELFNIKAFVSYGLSITWHEMGLAFIYALICSSLYLFAAIICFNERDIT